MAIDPDHKAAFVAFNRFSFGARGGAYAGDLARAASDPRGFLRAELLQPAIARLDAPALPQTKVALATVFADQEQKRRGARTGCGGKGATCCSAAFFRRRRHESRRALHERSATRSASSRGR